MTNETTGNVGKQSSVKVGLIRNPASGRGAGALTWDSIESRLRQRFSDLIIEETTAPGSARKQAASLASSGCEIVIASGGDGTVCDVMQGVLGSSAALAILPMGTGNDFARTLGFGPNIDQALDAIFAGHRERIDVGKWQIGDEVGHFINVAGWGFDGAVADRVNKGFRNLRGRTAYMAAIFQTLFSYRPTRLSLLVDGKPMETRAMLCALANARTYGGGLMIAPTAELQDGLLDLVLVGELTKPDFLMNFPKVMKGKHLAHPKVTHLTFRELEMESDPEIPFLVDGELLPTGKVKVSVVPKALDVLMP